MLDGYPRTIEQAHALDENLADLGIELQGVINIEIDPSKLVERLSGRIIHKETGETFHKVFNPPVGDYKEEDFYQREDDKPESVKRRLEVNIAQGQPIIDHYRAKGWSMILKVTKTLTLFSKQLIQYYQNCNKLIDLACIFIQR